MNDSTNCPLGTTWCTDHRPSDEDLQVGFCTGQLWTNRALSLRLTGAVAPSIGLMGPFIGLGGWDINPAQARILAAALLRAAETVETAQTETCSSCRRSVMPFQVRDGECTWCQNEQRDRVRESMRVVR